jgi:hypothetical protein
MQLVLVAADLLYPQQVDEMETLAWVVGPVAGVVIGPLMILVHLVVGIRTRRAWPLWTGATLLIALAGSVWLYWQVFWRSLDFAFREPNPVPIPHHLIILERTALSLSVVFCLALVATGTVALAAGHEGPVSKNPQPS